ncbi:MAG TPA: hemolysin family protein [Jiangellaceae bacterium]|nr:hemolysin family protein [Jiangellaceae bacterium]
MSSDLLVNIALVLLFILIGGVFAATEIALISLRESQLTQLEQRGRRGERVAQLANNPNRFLGAVQIGVTVAGFFSAAFGATMLADDVSPLLERMGVPQRVAEPITLVVITLAIAFVSLVLGELAPKRIALQRSMGVSLVVGPALDRFATLMRPFLWLMSKATDVIVRLLGGDPGVQREQVTAEELRELVSGHEELGEEERRIVEDVFDAGDRQLREVMLPRTEVDFLDAGTPVYQAVKQATLMPHSRYPVVRGSADDVVGFVHVRDLFAPDMANRSVRVGEIARDVIMLPGTKRVLPALSEMRRSGGHLAIVVDEYGGTAGIVTLEDLVEELVGDIRDEYDVAEEAGGPVAGGGFTVDGLMNLEDFADRTGVELPDGPYETVAGFVVASLGRLPRVGDTVDVEGCSLEVLTVDGRRASRLRALITRTAGPTEPANP